MNRSILFAPIFLVGCRQVAGISTITYEAGGPVTGCTNGTLVLTSADSLDVLSVAGGYDIVGVPDQTSASGLGYSNLHACKTDTPCTQPPGLLTLGFNDVVMDYAASSSQIVYAVETNETTGAGAIHSVGFDGTGDKTLLASATWPAWMATSGASTFWVSDDQSGSTATLHCIGCGGNTGDQTWFTNTNLTTTLGAFADTNTVYVVADDGSANATSGIYTCSTTTACGSSPKLLAKGFQFTSLNVKSEVVSDGTNVYVTNESSAIAKVTPAGTQTTIANGVTTTALAVDGATGDLFYGAENGTVSRMKTDGTGTPVALSSCDADSPNDIIGIAVDSTNVYVILSPLSGNSSVWAIKRN